MTTVDSVTKVYNYSNIVYAQLSAKKVSDPLTTKIHYGNKVEFHSVNEVGSFAPNINFSGEGDSGLVMRIANKDFDNVGTNEDYAAVNINPIRDTATQSTVNFDLQAPDGAVTRYLMIDGPGATTATIKFDRNKLPNIGLGGELGVGATGILGFATSSIKYKELIEGENKKIKSGLFDGLIFKEFYYYIDDEKIPYYGPIAEDVLELAGEDLQKSFNSYKGGELLGIKNNQLIYYLIDELRNKNNALEIELGEAIARITQLEGI